MNKEKRQRLTPSAAYAEDLEAAICMLREDWAAFMKEKVPKDEIIEPPEFQSNASIEKYMKGKNGPLTRLTITSDIFHANNPHIAKLLFGFEDPRKKEDLIQQDRLPISGWNLTKEFIFIMFGLEQEEPTIDLIEDGRGRNRQLSSFEECILTLTFVENKFERKILATLFGLDHKVVSDVIIRWAPLFREVGYDLARLELTKEFLDKSYPQSYVDMNFAQKVASIVDGSDGHTQTSRKNRYAKILLASNKTGGSAFRGITWSTPMGMVHDFTDPFFGRASEKSLVSLWAMHGRLRDIPIGYVMLGDKGFDQTSGFYHNFVPVIHPAFLKKGMQFTEEQLEWNRRACELRYTCEVVFSRVKKQGNLGGSVSRNDFPFIRDIWAWAHGRANLYMPLQRPANDAGYFGESKYTKDN